MSSDSTTRSKRNDKLGHTLVERDSSEVASALVPKHNSIDDDSSRYTNIDYYDKIALKADEVLKMRPFCSLIEDEREYQIIMVALLKALDTLKLGSKSCSEDLLGALAFDKIPSDSSSTSTSSLALSSTSSSISSSGSSSSANLFNTSSKNTGIVSKSKQKKKRRKTNSSSYGFRFDGDDLNSGIDEIKAVFADLLGVDEDFDHGIDEIKAFFSDLLRGDEDFDEDYDNGIEEIKALFSVAMKKLYEISIKLHAKYSNEY